MSTRITRAVTALSLAVTLAFGAVSSCAPVQHQAPAPSAPSTAVPAPEQSTQPGLSHGAYQLPVGAVEVTIVRIIDGDTLAVTPTPELPANTGAGDEHVVRLLGIDTPELNRLNEKEGPEPGAEEATENLMLMVAELGPDAVLVPDEYADPTDRYGRSLGYVQWFDDEGYIVDVAELQAIHGWADAYYPRGEPEPSRYQTYLAAVREAQDLGIGIWG